MRRALPLICLLAGLSHAIGQEPPKTETPAEPTPTDRPIRNAPSPRGMELAAYIFAAANVCSYRIGVPEFEALLAKLNTRVEDVGPRGPFGPRVQGIFALMSNDMAKHREQSCLAVAGEYGPEGAIAKNVLQPAPADAPAVEGKPPEPKTPEPAPEKPPQ